MRRVNIMSAVPAIACTATCAPAWLAGEAAAHASPNGRGRHKDPAKGGTMGAVARSCDPGVSTLEFDLTDERLAEPNATDPAQADSIIDERPRN